MMGTVEAGCDGVPTHISGYTRLLWCNDRRGGSSIRRGGIGVCEWHEGKIDGRLSTMQERRWQTGSFDLLWISISSLCESDRVPSQVLTVGINMVLCIQHPFHGCPRHPSTLSSLLYIVTPPQRYLVAGPYLKARKLIDIDLDGDGSTVSSSCFSFPFYCRISFLEDAYKDVVAVDGLSTTI